MSNIINIDEEISRLIQSVESPIPSKIENKLETITAAQKPKSRIWSKRLVFPLGVVTSAALIIAIVLLTFFPIQKTLESQISEIYTEFEIKDKNIKIIFVQRPDFNLFLEDENE